METTPGGRSALAFSLCLVAATIASADPVAESDAVRLFLEQSPHAQRIPLAGRSAGEARRAEALLSNPEVAYATEDAGGVRDEFLTVSQELPVTGRRGALRNSADAAASAASLAATAELFATVSDLRAAFYEVLYRERVSARFSAGHDRVERIVDILERREREGEASGYDLLRVRQELAEIAIDASAASAEVTVARARFGAFFDPERAMDAASLAGDLRPARVPPDEDELIARALAGRPDLKALHAEAHRGDLDRRAARRLRFPEPTLTAGWKRTAAVGIEDSGFVASLAVPLPLFDRGRATARRAEADRRMTELETRILEREIRSDVMAALARERAARDAGQRYGADVESRAAELRRIADLAYDEGEAGILELLDAYRTSLATELRALDVRYEVKRAEIERDRAIGAEVAP